MEDRLLQWLNALEDRHLQALRFEDVRRAVQALSSLYVERRRRIGLGSALDGRGKRAAFACYFAPLHFLVVREIVRGLGAGHCGAARIVDLGCGTGSAGAAWALEMNPRPDVLGVEHNGWAAGEARWTYATLGLAASVHMRRLETFRLPRKAAIIAAFTLNELPAARRDALLGELPTVAHLGSPVLVVEPIARRPSPWWDDWSKAWTAVGGRSDEWRFQVDLPDSLRHMDRAAGLDHRELTARSLWLPGRSENLGKLP